MNLNLMQPIKFYKSRATSLLSKEHNEQIFNRIRYESKSVYTTLVHLRILHTQSSLTWIKKDEDVLCFTKDYSNYKYFLQLYSLKHDRLIWERGLSEVLYTTLSDTFFVLDSKDYVFKFDFVSQYEAQEFNEVVKRKYLKLREKKGPKIPSQEKSNNKKSIFSGFFPRNLRRSLSKRYISVPLDAQHLSTGDTNPEPISESVEDHNVVAGTIKKATSTEASDEFVTASEGLNIRHSTNFVPAIIVKLGGVDEFESGEAVRQLVSGSKDLSNPLYAKFEDTDMEKTRQFVYDFINANAPETTPKRRPFKKTPSKKARAPKGPPPIRPLPLLLPPPLPPRRNMASRNRNTSMDSSLVNDCDNNEDALTDSYTEQHSNSWLDIIAYPSSPTDDSFSENEKKDNESLTLEDDTEDKSLLNILAVALAKRNRAFYSDDSAE